MSDETEIMWRSFLAESEEHLEAADMLISRFGSSRFGAAFSREDIASLFRAFHSLKGLSQAVDLTNMQTVAHHAEDLLGVVRDGRAMLDEPAVAMLQEVIDRLRRMREWVETRRTDAAPEPELIMRLGEMVRRSSAGVQFPAAAEPESGPTLTEPALTDDEEMLTLYGELVAERVPDFVEALVTMDGAAAAEGAEELVRGAEIIGLDRLADDLRGIAAHARFLPDATARSNLVLALANFRQQLLLLEELGGVSAGAAALGEALEAHARQEVFARVAAARAALEAADENDWASLGAVVAAAAAARSSLEVGGMPRGAAMMLLVEEQASRAAQGEIVWTPALGALAADVMDRVDGLEDDIEPPEAEALQADWQARMRGADPVPPSGARVLAALPAELRGALSDQQLARLEGRVGEGWRTYDLLLDTEGEPEIASDLAAWLSANTDVITSRTVSAGGMNWFEFLFATRHPIDHVRTATAALDPEQRCVRGLREISPPGAEVTADAPTRAAASVIRVRVDAIETLMDEIDEMRVTLGGLADALGELRQELMAARGALGPRAREIQERLATAIDIQQRVDAMHHEARAACIALRVVPVDTVFGRVPRMVRELAQRLQREVEFEISGRDARLDKSMADLLIDPLMHLVRNALDHGIEPPAERVAAGKPRRAKLVLAATEHSDGVHISVRDDGRGLNRSAILARGIERGLLAPGTNPSDREIYDLMFRSGFSTAAEVTEISGRGVGLDVVAHTLGRIGGTVDIETTAGSGTCFTMRVPASASLQNVLLLQAGELVAIPERRVVGAIILDAIETSGTQRIVWYREKPVPIHDLAALLGFPPPASPPEAAIIVADSGQFVAFAVDRMPSRREVFIKELHPLLASLPAIAGATLLTDGSPVLILDIDGVLERTRVRTGIDARIDA